MDKICEGCGVNLGKGRQHNCVESEEQKNQWIDEASNYVVPREPEPAPAPWRSATCGECGYALYGICGSDEKIMCRRFSYTACWEAERTACPDFVRR